MNKNIFGILLLALPVVLVLTFFTYKKYQINNAIEYRVAILGYDPRDLIRGHYLNLRIDWEKHLSDSLLYNNNDLCITADSNEPKIAKIPALKIEQYKKQSNCDYIIQSHLLPRRRLKFYIPDTDALKLEKTLASNTSNEKKDRAEAVIVFVNGQLMIKNIMFNSVYWKNWLLLKK